MKRLAIVAIAVGALAGCATALNPAAEKVRVLTASQKERCESLGIVSAEQTLGPNKPGNAMNKALNEVAKRGGNGLYVVTSGISGFDGASVTGEAMRCL